MLSEPERLAYLESLGITQYIATIPMPHGLTLPGYEWPDREWPKADSPVEGSPTIVSHLLESDTEDSQQSPAESSVIHNSVAHQINTRTNQTEPFKTELIKEINPTGNRVTAADLMPGEDDRPAQFADIAALDMGRLNKDLTPPQRAKTVRVSESRLKFALQIIATPKCRWVVELGLADSPGLSSLESQVVADLFLALGMDRELSQYRAKLFRWPLVDNPMIAADQAAAKDALISFLASDHSHDKTVFLGKLAPQVLAAADCGVAFTVAGNQGQCLWTHSLATLRTQWNLKAEAWIHLSAFLHNGATLFDD